MTATTTAAAGQALIEGLRRRDAYPHAVVEPVRVVETHISWVLLTGEFAYKIKKPVRLSFLDYSSLERRRMLCEEELRLNRRFAPELYLAVSPIGGSVARPRVDADGTPLEYAVRMRQFLPDDELGALLGHGAVTPADLAALGTAIARFHAAAEPAPPASEFGTAATVRRVTLDNFAELRALPEAAGWRDALDALERRVIDAHAALATRMSERRSQGRIRECHGDLHCGNVVRWRGALTPFDGIEFDPKLRFIDVVNDLAFLTMDLAERGHPELRRAALQAWVEAMGDWEGLRLLPFFETYRALVRAKVDALRALQLEPACTARGAAVIDSRRYLDWAAARLRGRRPPVLVMCGLSGSGKTWLARRLAPALQALHVRSDVERKRLAGLAAHEPSRSPMDGGIYTREFNARTYARLEHAAAAALAGGEPIVVDAAFLRQGERQRLADLARACGAAHAIVHCTAPHPLLRERVVQRAATATDASEAGLEVLARQPGYFEPFTAPERTRLVTVDTSDPTDVATALERITALVWT